MSDEKLPPSLMVLNPEREDIERIIIKRIVPTRFGMMTVWEDHPREAITLAYIPRKEKPPRGARGAR